MQGTSLFEKSVVTRRHPNKNPKPTEKKKEKQKNGYDYYVDRQQGSNRQQRMPPDAVRMRLPNHNDVLITTIAAAESVLPRR
jgi:hypothetical protein